MGLITAGGGLTNLKLRLANANSNEVLSGKTFYSKDKKLKTGTMSNRGAWGTTIDPGGSVTIPQGYHSGGGTVRANPASARVRTATLNASGTYSGVKVFTAAGTVICAGCQNISDGSYITVGWSGNQITVQETANSGQNRNITIVYAYYI